MGLRGGVSRGAGGCASLTGGQVRSGTVLRGSEGVGFRVRDIS